ncbi:MAG: hypothetical protein KAI29_05015 [Cyclobacteriaceae bacterium]|nr:hypothetical protein [Candidatus Paceibacterota bacterium]MCK5700487.1 hypothetical protein [Cyclobacteriaceae bacterium]
MTVECKKCINNTNNPSIVINDDGICNICESYVANFNKAALDEELLFLKSFIANKKYDAMVGLSSGKDSSATLYTMKKLGFTPLAFSFDIGYTRQDMFARSKLIANNMDIDHETINIKNYVGENDKKSFMRMAELYDKEENDDLKKEFKKLYYDSRKVYSTKSDVEFPFVRPCQICRKIVIKAYYAEAQKKGIQIIAVGFNEWTGLSNKSYSAIRKIQYIKSKPPIYIVHLPYLLQRNLADVSNILKEIEWEKSSDEKFINTGSGSCYLARACEYKAKCMMDFNMDTTRLSREITAGFLTKKQAKTAIHDTRKPDKSVRKVLEEAGLI